MNGPMSTRTEPVGGLPAAAEPAPQVLQALKGRKLLFVLNDAQFFLSHRLALAQSAQSAGCDVHIAVPAGRNWGPQESAGPELSRLGYPWHPIPLSHRGTNPYADARTLLSLFALYRRLRPDLVHHVTVKPNLYGGIAARLAVVPAAVFAVSGLGRLFVARGPFAALLRGGVSHGLALAFRHPNARVLFQNPADLEVLAASRTVPRDRAVVVPSGVDLDHFRATDEAPGVPVVLFAGRLLWEKGVAEFVEAARALGAEGVPGRFVLAGAADPGSRGSVPEDSLSGWEREGVIEWWGYHGDMAGALAGAHVACLPSYREGAPRFLIEAAACGRPTVATDVPGCRDVVAGGETGLLVPPRDSGALKDALGRLLRDKGLRNRMGVAARARAEARFDERTMVRTILSVYSDLLPAGSKGHPSLESDRG